MRSLNGYRELYKKDKQPSNKQQDEMKFNFTEFNPGPVSKRYPIFLNEASYETKEQRFERFIRQLNRAIYSCSLCKRGIDFFKVGNLLRDPHFVPSINYKKIAIIKYEPDSNDANGLLSDVDKELFYTTSIIKCPGNDKCDCPFFGLEVRALSEIWFKLVILLDKKSANKLGIEWIHGKLQLKDDCKYICCEYGDNIFNKLIKNLSNRQFRKHLLTS